MKENVLVQKSFSFAVDIVNLYKSIVKEKKEFVLSRQLLKSGTSIGANIEEAQGGYSKKDFKAKLSISYKEARETIYWLKLIHETNYIDRSTFDSMNSKAVEIAKILFTILKNTKT